MSKLARKVLSLYLVAALALPMLMGAMPVAAAGESSPMEMTPTAAGESIPEAELFARLGLSTASPAGSAGRAEMNPYGNKSVQIMTVNELALGVGNSMSIYGDGFIEGGNLSAKSVNPSGAWRNLTHVASMEGNFGGPNRMNSQSARKDALAVLGAYRLGNEYVFQVWAEGLAGAVGSVQLNIPGHAGNDIRIPASHFPDKQLQQNLHIATGDLNGDGFDEIIAILPMNNGASLGLYVWSVNNTSSETAFLSAANWTMEVTEIPGGFKLADWNTASLAVGDLNRDGCEDIAYVVSEVYVTKTRYDRHIETSRKYLERIYYGEDDFSLQSAKYERFAGDSYWAGWEDDISVMFPWEPGVAIADADPSGKAPNVLLLGYAIVNQASYVWDPQLTNVRVEVFRYDHAAQTPRMEAIKDSDSPYPLIYDSNFFPPNLNDMSLLGEVIIFKEAAAFCLAGGRLDPNAGPTIMMNDFIWTYSAGAFQREVFSAPTDLELIQRTYFSIRPANYTGSNPVLTLQYRNTRKTAVAPRIYAPPLFPMLASEYMDVVTTSYGYKDLPGISFKNVFMEVGDGINAPARKVVTNATDTTFFALPDVDVDSAILVYKNYQLMFSDPVVVAALAAPPYFTDLAAVDDRNNNYEESSTSFTVSSGSGTTATSSQTFEIGAYVAMDIAIGAGFAGTSVKAALEMEFEYNRGFTYESERTSTVVHDQKYTISAEDGDAVVLYCVPLDVYLYDLYVPKDIDGTIVYEPGNFYAVIPYKPVHNILSVADYDMVRQDHPDVLPDVKTEVFTHTVGDPATYPKSQIDGSQVFEQKSTYTSTGSMEQSIIITEDTSVGTATTNSYNFKAGGGVSVQSDFFDFEFKAGVTTGDSTSKGVMRTITNGTTYSASVMDKDNKNPRSGDYQFDWQLMCYMFKGTQNFPVITYLLTNVSSPARLPMDYGVLKTTSDSVKLYWEPGPEDDVLKGGAPLSNIEYKVYAVTNAAYGGDKIYRELTDTISYDGDEGIYTYCDGNLPAQTEFTYVITAAKRGVSGSVSTNSAEITAYTMRGGIYYDAQPQNIELTEKDSLTASLVAAAGYSREPITEWQKKSGIGNAWVTVSEPDYTTIKNIASATSLQSTLLFNDPSSAQAGIYRLVVKLEYGSIMWPIVSDPVTATYKAQNRVQSATTLGFDIQSGGAVNLRAEVAGSDGGAPTGVVQFKIESVSGNTPASYTGYAVAYLDGSGIAETTVLLSGTVVTHITATYSGDNRYAGSSDRTPVDIVPNRILRSIAAPNAITGVANGAAKSAAGLGLPSTVAMLTDAGYISANVAWDVASCSYNPDSPNPQSFAVTGAVTLPINVINPNDVSLTAAISVSVQPTSNAALLDILTGIEQPDSIVKDHGAVKTAAGLGLPAIVTITTSRNPMGISADVTWNVEYCAYDPGIGAEQTFNVSGTVTLPAGVINLDDLSLTVYAEVTVLPSSPSSTTWTYNGGSGWTPDRDPTDPPVTEPGKTITINGVAVSYAIDNNGIVTLKPTEAQIKQIIEASKDGNISIDPGGLSGITVNGFILEANPVWFGAEKFKSLTLTVKGVGSVLIKSNVMANLSKQNKVMRFSLKKGSLVFDISTVSDGKSINYNDPVNPLYIIIPVTLAADTTANGYVGVRKTASGNVIMPYSVYKNGEIIFQTAGTGSFDVIYNGKTFTDTAGHWASPNIMFVAARNLFNGYGNGVFAPQDTMTRSMFAQVLANIESVDPSAYKTSRFTDVKVGAWYAPAVEWAASVGIVNGYGGGLFGPEDEINREQMAVMLMNYVEYKGYNLPTGSTSAFSDEPAIASWAYDAVKMVQAAGIVVGKPGNIYDPKCTATRAEVATICARFIEMMENGVV